MWTKKQNHDKHFSQKQIAFTGGKLIDNPCYTASSVTEARLLKSPSSINHFNSNTELKQVLKFQDHLILNRKHPILKIRRILKLEDGPALLTSHEPSNATSQEENGIAIIIKMLQNKMIE